MSVIRDKQYTANVSYRLAAVFFVRSAYNDPPVTSSVSSQSPVHLPAV